MRPNPTQLARILRRFLKRQGQEVRQAIREGRPLPNLLQYAEIMAGVLFPVFLRLYQRGGERGVSMLRGRGLDVRNLGRTVKSWLSLMPSPYVQKDLSASFSFELFQPQVLEALRQMVFNFVEATLRTAQTDAETAYADLRYELSAGLEAGEALKNITERVQGIFDDPYRAFRVAATESSRAMHAGQLMAMREAGDDIVAGKRWLASSDACPICLQLNGQVRKLDEPFAIDENAKSPYNVIMHPPRHPFCFCDETVVLATDDDAKLLAA